MKRQIPPHRVEGVSRRQFLRIAGATMALTTIGNIAGWRTPIASATPALGTKRLVIVNLRGGNDGLNTVVPYSLSNYVNNRAVIGLTGANTIDVGISGINLHPSLVNVASLYGDGDVAIVEKVGYAGANQSHFTSEDKWSFGVLGSFTGLPVAPQSGWISRYADAETTAIANEPPGVISVGQSNIKDFQGAQVNPPLQMQSISRFRFDGERVGAYSNNHNYRLQVIADTLDNHVTTGQLEDDVVAAMQQAHQLTQVIDAARLSYDAYNPLGGGGPAGATYPTTTFGRRMRDIATLIYGGFQTRILYTGTGGYDTHSGQGAAAGSHANLLADIDNSLGAFAADLKAMDGGAGQVWNETLIIVISEFGRRVYENGSQGTDHGTGNVVLMLGGNTVGGHYGTLTNADLAHASGTLPYEFDFREIYTQALSTHLGVGAGNLSAVLPETWTANSPGTLVT
ncbi:MAG: DUF1501 domain-containing protein [Planctomycetota bacterium]